jgi:hypothetical protein
VVEVVEVTEEGAVEGYPAQGNSGDTTCQWSGTRFPAQGSSGGAMCRLGSSTPSRHRAPHVPDSRLRAAPGVTRVSAAPAPTSRIRAAPRAPRVTWAPALASRRRVALGAPHVPAAPGSGQLQG